MAIGDRSGINLPYPGLTNHANSNEITKMDGKSNDLILAFIRKSPFGKSSVNRFLGLPIKLHIKKFINPVKQIFTTYTT